MSDSLLPPEILELPVAARLVLVEELWDSIARDEQAFVLTDAHKTELDRRLELRKELPSRGTPWAEVKQRLIDML